MSACPYGNFGCGYNDCPLADKDFVGLLNWYFEGVHQEMLYGERIQSGRSNDDYKLVKRADVYILFDDINLIDEYWKKGTTTSGKGMSVNVCHELRVGYARYIDKPALRPKDRFGEFLNWDREYFNKPENRSKK